MIARDKDPPVRNAVLGTILIAVTLVFGVLVGLVANDRPIDLRWAEFDPVSVGFYPNEQSDNYSRLIDRAGTPVSNSDGTVSLAFRRCGPVDNVLLESRRSWIVTGIDLAFFGIQGQTIGIDMDPAPDCTRFSLDYAIPPAVFEQVDQRNNATVELRFELIPNDPTLGTITITSEPFRLWEPGLALETELRPIGE